MDWYPTPTATSEEYLEHLLHRIPQFRRSTRAQQLTQWRRIMEESNMEVMDLEKDLDLAIKVHADFLTLPRDQQLWYIDQLYAFINTNAGYRQFGKAPAWAVIFQLPFLYCFIRTTQPGGAYTSTSLGNWFLWAEHNT